MSAILEYPRKHPISAQEYLHMGEAGVFSPEAHLELIDGEIMEMAPIRSRHAAVVNALTALFSRAASDRIIVSAQNPLVIGERSVPQPDLALLRLRQDRYFNAHPMASDVLLVVEVSNTTLRFDLDTKISLYAHAGISEAWLIDVEKRALRVFRDPHPDNYRTNFAVSGDKEVSAGALADIAVCVASLFPA